MAAPTLKFPSWSRSIPVAAGLLLNGCGPRASKGSEGTESEGNSNSGEASSQGSSTGSTSGSSTTGGEAVVLGTWNLTRVADVSNPSYGYTFPMVSTYEYYGQSCRYVLAQDLILRADGGGAIEQYELYGCGATQYTDTEDIEWEISGGMLDLFLFESYGSSETGDSATTTGVPQRTLWLTCSLDDPQRLDCTGPDDLLAIFKRPFCSSDAMCPVGDLCAGSQCATPSDSPLPDVRKTPRR